MNPRPRPAGVVTALVLLMLIAVYQAVTASVRLLSVVYGPQEPRIPSTSFLVGGTIGVVYCAAAVVLAVMVARGVPRARPAVVGVNVTAALVVLALMATPVYALDAVIIAAFALVTAALMATDGACDHFVPVPLSDLPGPRAASRARARPRDIARGADRAVPFRPARGSTRRTALRAGGCAVTDPLGAHSAVPRSRHTTRTRAARCGRAHDIRPDRYSIHRVCSQYVVGVDPATVRPPRHR
ncbi:hypothetical protein [Nocardiopsis sp. MG754419]|uniref:hypothetical protein n=1 Tax=Nocardiopsis sp. MG754419 TaxID=2259865 RepID=UPI001BA798F6|nr:hypothetical protein [Nocardiopsis sp. MG754419]MBR8744605.1 hypothetical protein [Nocardiopsis sp. MG754419]